MLAAITGKLPLSIERFESERLGLRIDLGGELASGRVEIPLRNYRDAL